MKKKEHNFSTNSLEEDLEYEKKMEELEILAKDLDSDDLEKSLDAAMKILKNHCGWG